MGGDRGNGYFLLCALSKGGGGGRGGKKEDWMVENARSAHGPSTPSFFPPPIPPPKLARHINERFPTIYTQFLSIFLGGVCVFFFILSVSFFFFGVFPLFRCSKGGWRGRRGESGMGGNACEGVCVSLFFSSDLSTHTHTHTHTHQTLFQPLSLTDSFHFFVCSSFQKK